jgi:hypothetical protein
MTAIVAPLESLVEKLKAAASIAERVHRGNLELFTREALRLLSKGDVRDAAEKAWAAYKSLLGLLVVRRLLPEIEGEAERIAKEKGLEKAGEYIEWWIEQGLLIPSTGQKLAEIVKKLVEVTGDREIAEKRMLAALLHIFFYHGPDITEVSEEEAAKAVKDLVEWVRRKARQYNLL